MRKIIIGFVAVGFIALLFFAYAKIMDVKTIKAQSTTGSNDLEMPKSGNAVQQAGDTDVRVAKEARYVVLDPETKEISRVFGFEKLLNQGMDTSRRQVERPYMIFYDPDYQCRIDADMGMFQIETSGSSSTPKDARLNGNVKIHVTPRPGSRVSETIVEMDDLVFSSERSEFATDGKVHIKSEQVELKGTGLIVIFDPANGRIDYLRIRDLDQIRMQDLSDSKSETKVAKAETIPPAEPGGPTQEVEHVAVSPVVEKETEASASPVPRYYKCTLEDNVEIQYGNEIIVAGAEKVNIQNISFDQIDKSDEKAEPEQTKKKPATAENTDQPPKQTQVAESTEDAKTPVEILVTCDGGIVLEPMEDADIPQKSVAGPVLSVNKPTMPLRAATITPVSHHAATVEMVSLAGQSNETAQQETTDNADTDVASDPNDAPPTKFEARTIDYDLLTGSGLAHGPVRITFYQDSDPNSTTAKVWNPVTVTADDKARFIADSSQTIEQVVFSGNVMTTRESSTPNYAQLDKIHSEKLTIDLDEVEAGQVDLSHLSVTEGRVYVESQRTLEDRELSRVKLYCTELSYDKVADVILAEGPGKIEMVNYENTEMAGSDPNNPMNQPCVAMVDNYSAIRWDMGKQRIVADGDQDAMKLAYYPISDGLIQKRIFVYSMQIELSYLPGSAGISKVFTDKSIIYEEWNHDQTQRIHHVVGQVLDYDAVEGGGWVKIEGTPAVPCYLDGARAEQVLVHPVSGEIKTSISVTPGVIDTQ